MENQPLKQQIKQTQRFILKIFQKCSHSLSCRKIFCFIPKTDPILANKLYNDEMKTINFFSRFSLKSIDIMEINSEPLKYKPDREKNGYYLN